MSGSGNARFRLRFALRRAWSTNRRSWRCHVAFGDEPLGLHRHRPSGGSYAVEGFIMNGNPSLEEAPELLDLDELEREGEGNGMRGEWEGEVEPTVFSSAARSGGQFAVHQHGIRSRSTGTQFRATIGGGEPQGFGEYSEGEYSRVQSWVSGTRRLHCSHGSLFPASASSLDSRVHPQSPEPQPSFPCSPDEVTAEWLTDLLRKTDAIPQNVKVKGLLSRRMGEGVGLLSLLHRLEIEYSPEPVRDAPKTLVVKFGHPSAEVRRMASANGSYEREVGAYQLLQNLGSELGLGGRSAGQWEGAMRTPKVYCAQFDTATGQMLVVMEDLAGRRHLDQLEGASLAQALAVVRETAKSHARFWDDPQLASLHWLPRMSDDSFKSFDPREYLASWPAYCRLFGGTAHRPALLQQLEALPQHCPALLDHMGSRPITLLHGDLRLDNVYQLNDDRASSSSSWASALEDSRSLQLLFMDFGDCCAGRGPSDVAYFLSQSLDPSLRKMHERKLLREYWEILVGPGGVGGYGLEECWEDYRIAVLYYWVLAVNVCGHVDENADGESRVLRLAEAMSQRSLAAILDLDCLHILKEL